MEQLKQQWGLYFDEISELQRRMEGAIARELTSRGYYKNPMKLSTPMELMNPSIIIREMKVDDYACTMDRVWVLIDEEEEWKPLFSVANTDQYCTIIYKLHGLKRT